MRQHMKSKKIYSAFAVVLSLIMLLINSVVAMAITKQEIDSDRKGSICVTIQANDFIAGSTGSLTIYKVAEYAGEDTDYHYALTSDFMDSGIPVEDISEESFVGELEDYALEHELKGMTAEVENGKVLFRDLSIGLYLVVQSDAIYEANDKNIFLKVSSFVVSVPAEIGEKVVYDIDATPKTVVLPGMVGPEEEETTTEKVTQEPVTTTVLEPKNDLSTQRPKLPQTGLLVWPVLLLVMSGCLMITFGWWIKTTEQKKMRKDNEA